jgi:hypothetical protein
MSEASISSAPKAHPRSSCCGGWSSLTFAAWLVRIAAAALLLTAGFDKFKSTTAPHTYAQDNWYGTPEQHAAAALPGADPNWKPKWAKIVNVVFENSGLNNGNVFSESVVNFNSQMFAVFGKALPWMFIVSGLLILAGSLSVFGHFLGGITWLSLAIGQMMLPEASFMMFLLFFMLFNVAGILLNRYNRLTLDDVFKGVFRPSAE